MKVKWVRRKGSSTYVRDITQAVASVSWGGSVSQAARTAEVAVINAPDDTNVESLRLGIGAGDAIKLYGGGSLIFYGEVQRARKESGSGAVAYDCCDLLNHMLKSTGIYNFSDTTAERVAKKVCADAGIKTGSIAGTKAAIKKMIVDGDTLYYIIMKAYKKAARQTGQKYICRMDGDKLSVAVKGTKVTGFMLAEGYNITNVSYEETIDNMVNVVKIYDEKGVQVGEVKKGEWAEKYGIYQKAYKKESGVNAKAAASNMLQGVEKKVSLDGIDGDLRCIAGNGVEVHDKATGLKGLFWIDSDTHTWKDGVHTMSLELNFKNIVGRQVQGG